MNIGKFLTEEFIWLKTPSQSHTQVFEEVSIKGETLGYVDENFLEKIKERENTFPTGLQLDGYGVAIPHTDPECIKKQFIAVITPEDDIPFMRMDNVNEEVKVKLIFVLGLNQPHSQLSILQELMVLLQDKEVVGKIRNSVDKNEIIEYLSNLSTQKQR